MHSFVKQLPPISIVSNACRPSIKYSNTAPGANDGKTLFYSGLGIYAMAMRILSLPTILLQTHVIRVYFQEASQRYKNVEDIGEFSIKILKTNIKLAIIPLSLLMIFGEYIFAIFLSEQWREAGTYAAVIGMHQLMLFCNNCLSGGLIIGKTRINLYVAIVMLASICYCTQFFCYG